MRQIEAGCGDSLAVALFFRAKTRLPSKLDSNTSANQDNIDRQSKTTTMANWEYHFTI
jgi:hypothetical protein